jgi:hypothetical protein
MVCVGATGFEFNRAAELSIGICPRPLMKGFDQSQRHVGFGQLIIKVDRSLRRCAGQRPHIGHS